MEVSQGIHLAKVLRGRKAPPLYGVRCALVFSGFLDRNLCGVHVVDNGAAGPFPIAR